jgi:translation initiation factor 4E
LALASHPLRTTWVFWFRPPSYKGNGFVEYEKTLHAMASCATAEEFFAIYRHLKRPSELPLVSDYHLFRKDVRPIWEDEENKSGGKWIVRLKKGVSDRYWEDLLLAITGDQFGEAGEEICGAVLSVRNGEDILSVWMRADGGRVLRIRYDFSGLLSPSSTTQFKLTNHPQRNDEEATGLPTRHQSRVEEPRHQHPAADGHRRGTA